MAATVKPQHQSLLRSALSPFPAPVPLLLVVALALLCAQAEYRPDGVDPYEALGLKRGDDLSPAALKRAYRQAALRWHPDKVPESEKKEAEQRFIGISWAYEVLSDPSRRSAYDSPPGSGGAGAGPGGGPGAGGAGGPGGPGGPGERDFDMDAAAKVFRDVFGTASEEYQHLIKHLMGSATSGNKKQWRKHAEAIKEALATQGGTFEVETGSKDGSERMRTRQKTTNDGKGTTTKHTVTEHSRTTVNGPGETPHLHHGGGGGNPALDAHNAHMAAHEAALKATQEQHRKATARTKRLPGSDL